MRSHPLAAAALLTLVDASSLTPPVLPLIVRNPYLSTWLPGAREEPWKMWPRFWEGGDLGFSILAQVPASHEVYPLLGRPQDFLDKRDTAITIKEPYYKGASYDASTTNLTYLIPAPSDSKHEDLDLVLSFLSPITPTSTARQTIPAAYLKVYVQGKFDLNLYLDVNGQWVSGKHDSALEWNFVQQEPKDSVPGLKTWKVKRQVEQLFTETHDQAEWGQLHFTGPADARHESGKSWELRQRFARTGTLQNQIDKRFRSIFEDEPIFAFSKTFNLTTSHSSSALFTFAHIQNPVTQYASARGLTYMRPLWESFYPGGDDNLIQVHYGDFENTFLLASNYSEQLRIDAYKSGSHNYVDIVALSARQVMGATSFSGTPENPLLFLKEISSNGNTQTVDVIFPAYPFFLYTQPKWGAYLLEPLLEHQLSGQYPNKYSMHDLGYHFPNFTGHADGNDEYMPLEECGDMLIMALALINSFIFDSAETAQSIWSTAGNKPAPLSSEENVFALTNLGTVDGISHIDEHWRTGADGVKAAKQWASRSYDLLLQWTSYLEEFSLEPHNQLSTDDFAGWLPYMTNLALKGIIGIKAFSEIATLLDKPDVAKNYRNISETYITKWEKLGTSPDGTHAKISYHWYGSWTTLYSLYADALLCFHPTITSPTSDTEPFASSHGSTSQEPLDTRVSSAGKEDFIPHRVYKKQSDWYSLVLQRYGLPLDSRHLYTKSDWQFQAAAVSSPKTRKQILDRVALWVNETNTDLPFTDLFETEGEGGFGSGIRFTARPVVGGHFSFLALERSCGGKFGAQDWEANEEGEKVREVVMDAVDEL